MDYKHGEEIRNAALRILEIAHENCIAAEKALEELQLLVLNQEHRISSIRKVIDELNKFV